METEMEMEMQTETEMEWKYKLIHNAAVARCTCAHEVAVPFEFCYC